MDKNKKFYSNAEVSRFRDSSKRIFGEPASNISLSENKDISNLRGHYGELIIGNMLNLLACETEGFYVFHSIDLPLTHAGETDHAVVYKNKIILIETKAFSGFDILRVNEAGVLRGRKVSTGERYRVEDNKIFNKIDLYQKRFDNREVSALLVVARNDIQTSSDNPKYKVASLDNFSKILREELAEAKAIKEVPWPAIKFFSLLCLKHQSSPT